MGGEGESWTFAEMLIAFVSTKLLFLLLLHMHFGCTGNVEFP